MHYSAVYICVASKNEVLVIDHVASVYNICVEQLWHTNI